MTVDSTTYSENTNRQTEPATPELPSPALASPLLDLAERVEAGLRASTLPVCPYDRRSPDYWTTPDDKPCVVCGTLNDPDAPNLCRGADLRIMDEAADLISSMSALLRSLASKQEEETTP